MFSKGLFFGLVCAECIVYISLQSSSPLLLVQCYLLQHCPVHSAENNVVNSWISYPWRHSQVKLNVVALAATIFGDVGKDMDYWWTRGRPICNSTHLALTYRLHFPAMEVAAWVNYTPYFALYCCERLKLHRVCLTCTLCIKSDIYFMNKWMR